MFFLAIAMQIGAAQLQLRPITEPLKYDVDLAILRGTDTLAMPLLRLAEGLEGRVTLAQTEGPSLLLRTMVYQERDTGCHVLTLKIGKVSPEQTETIFIPQTTGRLCGVELIQMANGTGKDGTLVVARVHPLPKQTDKQR